MAINKWRGRKVNRYSLNECLDKYLLWNTSERKW